MSKTRTKTKVKQVIDAVSLANKKQKYANYTSHFLVDTRTSPRSKSVKRLVEQGLSAIEIINQSAPGLAAYLVNCGMSVTKPHWARIDAAKFILQQHLNHLKAQGLVDEAGNRIVNYKTLIILANQFISNQNIDPGKQPQCLRNDTRIDENKT